LVTPEVFEKVQVLLTASRNGRDRPQVHEQYLTGSLYCAECGSRLVFSRIKNRHGKVYDYFCCLGRKSRKRGGSCTTGHYSVAEVERAVERLYRAVRIDPGTQEAVRRDLVEHLEAEQSVIHSEIARHEKRVEGIKTKQAKLLELAYEDLVSKDVLRDEQERLRAEERAIDGLLRQAHSGGDGLLAALDEALERHNDPEGAYAKADPLHRRAMNRLMFERIEIGPDDAVIEAVALAPVVEVIRHWDPELVGPDWTPGTVRAGPSRPSPGPFLGAGFDLPVGSSTSCSIRRPRPGGAFGVSGPLRRERWGG
jgi:hypothetical protein